MQRAAPMEGWRRSPRALRLNRLPSHAAYKQLRANETHAAGQETRRSAVGDTYGMILLPASSTGSRDTFRTKREPPTSHGGDPECPIP